jgi:hypothetical protein
VAREAAEVVTGTDREVVDQAMRGGATLPHPREAVVDGPEDREVAAVEDQDPVQEAVRVSDRAKPRCNGQAAVLALKSTSIVVKSVTGPHPGTPNYMDKKIYEDQILSENLRKFVE